jgi:CotH kinase protein/Chitobiase/beta-hexosaminidase C-terminal domain
MRLWMRRVAAACSLCLLALIACSSDSGAPGAEPAANADAGTAGDFAAAGRSSRGAAGSSAATGGSAVTAGSSGASSSSVAGASGTSATPPAPTAPPKPTPTLIGDVTFSVPSGTFRGELAVTLTTQRAGAEIRFTTDGQPPSASSMLYTQALQLTATTQLRAQAFAQGVPSGNPSTAIYVARSFDFTSDLPIVVVDGYGSGKPMDKKVYKDAAFMVFEPSDGTASLAARPNIASRAGYHVRGQSSVRLPQTPYRVELWNNAGEDEDYAVLGMPADSDWALIPPYYDRSLVRNPLVYELGRDIGLPAPRVRFAEVYVNYEARPLAAIDYLGVYWITETIKNNRDRLDLKQLEEGDTAPELLSGGYIFKFDQAAAEEPKLVCTGSPPISTSSGFGMMGQLPSMPGGSQTPQPSGAKGTCWSDLEVVDPEPLAAEQAAWLTRYLLEFQNLIHATPIGDYAAYIDVDSFVNYLIINELTRNVDSYVRSAYYHKDRGGLLRAGPLWDYNFSLGVGGQNSIDPMGGWQYRGSRNLNDWYPKLTAEPAFMERVKARWNELRAGALSDDAIGKRIDALIAPLANAAARDYEKWHVADILKPNAFVRGPGATTWTGQVQALRDFVRVRAAWMDSQLR